MGHVQVRKLLVITRRGTALQQPLGLFTWSWLTTKCNLSLILMVSHGCDVLSLKSLTLVSQSCCTIAPVFVFFVRCLAQRGFVRQTKPNGKCLGWKPSDSLTIIQCFNWLVLFSKAPCCVCQFHGLWSLVNSAQFLAKSSWNPIYFVRIHMFHMFVD